MTQDNKGEDKVVTLKQSEMQAIMKKINDLTEIVANQTDKKADRNGGKSTRPTKGMTVTVFFIDNKPVVGIANKGTENVPIRTYEVPDQLDPKRRILLADIEVKNMDTNEIEVIKGLNFMDFLQEGERRECSVIKPINREWFIEDGSVNQRQVEGYNTIELDIEVPLEIQGTVRHYIVDIDGQGVEIHEDYVNMAKASQRQERVYK